MTIHYSRHARRRIKLYNIPANGVTAAIDECDRSQGHHEVVLPFTGFSLPIRIVYEVEGETITVVTAYPLKRGRTQ